MSGSTGPQMGLEPLGRSLSTRCHLMLLTTMLTIKALLILNVSDNQHGDGTLC